ncbi:hypothetical protein Tco_0983204 [Tanacetum coccineum]
MRTSKHGDSLNLPDHRIHKDGDGDASFQLESDSLPHAHAQTTKTYYKHQDSRIMKAQELKTKTSAQTLIYKIFLQRYQVYQGRLLASFQDDAKYEHQSCLHRQITYTSITSDYEEPSNAGSPGVVAPLSPTYAPEPEYLEYLVPSDAEAPMEDQPLPGDASPTTLSSGYVADSDSEEDPKEDHADYPADGGDDDDDESSDDVEENEEEEHLAPADCSVVPTVDPVPSAEDTEAFETDESAPTPVPSPRHRTARMSVRPQIPMSDTAEALIAEAARIRLRAASPSTHHPSEIPSPPLLLPSTTHRDDLPEADMPLQKRARFTAPTGRFKVGESSSAAAARQAGHTLAHRVDYGFIDTMDASIRASESRAMTAIGEVNDRVTDLATTQRQDAQELYAWSHSKSRIQAMEAQIRALQRDVDVLQRQRIRDEDRLTAHIQHEHDRFRDLVRAAEAGPQDGPEDAGSSC